VKRFVVTALEIGLLDNKACCICQIYG